MKKISFMMVIAALLLAVLPAAAQTEALAYGDIVTGDLTDRVTYTFTGTKDDIVLVVFGDETFESTLGDPTLSVQGADGTDLVTASGFGTVEVFTELPEDGTYTIVASASEAGRYSLGVFRPEVLQPDKPLQGTLTSEEINYFVIQNPDPFVLIYEQTGGDFHPQVSLNVQGDFGLEEVAFIGGGLVSGGTLNIQPDPGMEGVYVVTVEQALFDFNFEPASADYTLTMSK